VAAQHANDHGWTQAAQSRVDFCGPVSTGCVRLLDYFAHTGPNGTHICMCFDVMGPNVLALIKRCDFRGVPHESVRKVAAHTLAGLDYLHRFCGIIHTDLKPENVLVTCPWRVPIDKLGFPLIDLRSQSVSEVSPEEIKAKAIPEALAEGSPPYVKPLMKPSRSDPTLLSSFGDDPRHLTPYSARTDQARANGGNRPRPKAFDFIPADQQAKFISEGVNPFNHTQAQYRLADLGNACWINRHFSEEIQTRQYRCPEVILGAGYGPSADIWSLACMVFELVTGDYLFDPKGTEEYPRDEDHLALCIELLGPVPQHVQAKGRHRRTYFNLHGQLRHIKSLRGADLESVLRHKYRMAPVPARSLASFLMPMLALDPDLRPTAQRALEHPWLKGLPSDDCNEFFKPHAALGPLGESGPGRGDPGQSGDVGGGREARDGRDRRGPEKVSTGEGYPASDEEET